MITLELTEYLELLWGYKDKVVIARNDKHYKRIRAEPSNEAIFHIQENEKDINVIVWRARDWEMEYQRHLLKKEQSEIRVKEWNELKDTGELIRKLIIDKVGAIAGAMVADTLVADIIKTKNKQAALMFGCPADLLKDW